MFVIIENIINALYIYVYEKLHENNTNLHRTVYNSDGMKEYEME
jgi:hypothetical protein